MEPNYLIITVAVILGGTGLALLFVGILIAVLVALGNKHYISGIAMFIFFPYMYVYFLRERINTAYAQKLAWPGTLLVSVFIALLWWELHRLGLDFIDVMATTKPKH